MKITKCGPVLALGMLFAFLVTSPVHADTVYTYTGTPFTTCFGNYTCTSTGPQISITFDTTTPLPANLPYATEISNEVRMTFVIRDGTGFSLGGTDLSVLAVGTDANGNINQWSVFALDYQGDMGSSDIAGQSLDFSNILDAGTLVGGGDTRGGPPGTWTVNTPEPSILLLLGAGLLSLALIGVRR